MRRPKDAAFMTILVAAVVPSAAAPHGGSAPKGFVTTVDAIRPAVPDLEVTVIGGDERMRMVNRPRQDGDHPRRRRRASSGSSFPVGPVVLVVTAVVALLVIALLRVARRRLDEEEEERERLEAA